MNYQIYLVRKIVCVILAALFMVLSSGYSQAASLWTIANGGDKARIDASGRDGATNFPNGVDIWSITDGFDAYDAMYRQWFWFRIGAEEQKSLEQLTLTTSAYSPDRTAATLTYDEDRFTATVVFKVGAKPSPTFDSSVIKTITITNKTSSELDYHFYSYTDIDLSKSGGSDNAIIVNGSKAFQKGFGTGADEAYNHPYTAIQTSSLKPSHFTLDNGGPNVGSFLDQLDTSPDPMEIADFAGPWPDNEDMQFAFQYDLKVPPNGSITFTITDTAVPSQPLVLDNSLVGGSCADYASNTTFQYCFSNPNTFPINDVTVSSQFLTPDTGGSFPFVSATNNGAYDSSTNTVSWNLASMAAGAQKCEQVTVKTGTLLGFTSESMAYSDSTYPTLLSLSTALCNSPPLVQSDPAPPMATTGVQYTFQVPVFDAEKDPLTCTLISGPSGLKLSSQGAISWLPASQQGKPLETMVYPVSFDVSDGHSVVHHTLKINLQWQNQLPTAPTPQNVSAEVDKPLSFEIVASDPDFDTLNFSTSDSLPAGFTLYDNGVIRGIPTAEGTYTINVSVADTHMGTTTTKVTITVGPSIDPPPTISPTISPISSLTVAAGIPFRYQVVASDPQNKMLSYTLGSAPAGMTIGADGLISWGRSLAGSYSITVTATNTSNLSATQSFTLTVTNQAPTVSAIAAATITARAAYSCQVFASDPNGDTLSYTLSGAPAGMTISASGLINWATSVAGSYSITVKAIDPGGLNATQSFTLTVNAVPAQPPTMAAIPNASIDECLTFTYQTVASDPQGESLTYVLSNAPEGITIGSNGLIIWDTAIAGIYPITVTATNTSNLKVSKSFTLTVIAVNTGEQKLESVSLNVPATNNSGMLRISWALSTVRGVTYRLEMSRDGGVFAPVYSSNRYNYAYVTVTEKGNYTFQLKVTKSGYTDSDYSTGSSQVTLTCGVPTGLLLPATNTTGTLKVVWRPSNVAGATYLLEMSKDGGTYSPVYTGASTSATITFPADGTYNFRIKATKPGYTDSAYVSADCRVTLVCSTPGGITVPATNSSGSIDLSWKPGAGVTGAVYVVEMSKDGGEYRQVYSGSITSTTVRVSENGRYTFRVKSTKSNYADSDYVSDVCKVTLGVAKPAKPRGITVPAANFNGVLNLFWKDIAENVCDDPRSFLTPVTSSSGLFMATWNSSTPAARYVLEVSKDGGDYQVYRSDLGGNFANVKLIENGTYKFRLKATKPNYLDSKWVESTTTVQID